MNNTPLDNDYDDSLCVTCGTKLPVTVLPFTWQDNGFCGLACVLRLDGPVIIAGTAPVIELARVSGAQGGPGFEEDGIKAWRYTVKDGGELSMWKLRSEDDRGPWAPPTPGSWSWRVRVHGHASSLAFRLTARQEAGVR